MPLIATRLRHIVSEYHDGRTLSWPAGETRKKIRATALSQAGSRTLFKVGFVCLLSFILVSILELFLYGSFRENGSQHLLRKCTAGQRSQRSPVDSSRTEAVAEQNGVPPCTGPPNADDRPAVLIRRLPASSSCTSCRTGYKQIQADAGPLYAARLPGGGGRTATSRDFLLLDGQTSGTLEPASL